MHRQRYLSLALRSQIKEALLQGIATRAILEQVQKERLEDFRIRNCMASLDEAETLMKVRRTWICISWIAT